MKIDGIELVEAGYKIPKDKEKAMDEVSASGIKEDGKRYASMYVDSKEVPGIEKMEYGKQYVMISVVEVKRIETSENESYNGKKETRTSANLQICEVGFKPVGSKKEPSEMDDEELENEKKSMVDED